MTGANILIVEDESLIAADLKLRLQQLGYDVAGIIDNAADACAYASIVKPDLALMDIHIKGELTGIEVARRFHEQYRIPVVFMTAHADTATINEATATEPYGYVVKPFDKRALAATIETALSRRRAEAAIEKMERWLATTLNSIGDAVIATDAEYRIAFINQIAGQLTGWSRAEALGRPLTEVVRIASRPGDDLLAERIEAVALQGLSIDLDGVQLIRRDRTQVPIDDSIAPIRDASGSMTGIVIVFRDSTERQRMESELRELNTELERRVRLRTAQLEAANQELEAFSYSIAHDLRAPLRAVNAFSERLIHDHSGQLDPEGQRLLNVVTSRTRQMSTMIDDYLRLSKLGRVALNREPLDMAQLVHNAWRTVTEGQPTGAQLEVGALPRVHGDTVLMEQVWTNLLSNAVKFSRHLERPTIRVSGSTDERTARFVVEDNGIGFDPGYSGKLFQMFERLHPTAEFEGNGVGLCIVRRILNRHDGDVQVEGRPGNGVTVTFWMPFLGSG